MRLKSSEELRCAIAAKPSSWRRNAAASLVLSSDPGPGLVGSLEPALPRLDACVETLLSPDRTSRLRSPVDLVERCVYVPLAKTEAHVVNGLNILALASSLSSNMSLLVWLEILLAL